MGLMGGLARIKDEQPNTVCDQEFHYQGGVGRCRGNATDMPRQNPGRVESMLRESCLGLDTWRITNCDQISSKRIFSTSPRILI